MTDLTRLAARQLGRPLLITPQAAEFYTGRIRAIDPNFAGRPSRLTALVRRLAARPQPKAMDDEAAAPVIPFGQLGAYHPLYVDDVEDTGFCWSLKDGVALMQCDTPLLDRGDAFCGMVWHGYDTLLSAMQEASADPRVKAIFLRADSPGGVVSGGLNVLADWMRANRAAAGGKPIWVYADMACSAMYWIAAQADRIVAPDVGQLGSIGAVLVHESWAGFLEKSGVKVTPIQFGAKKTDGNYWDDLSDGARADLQAEIDQCGRNFVAAVTAGRSALGAEALLATQAACYLARHDDPARSALALGFCDEIMGEEAAFQALAATVSGVAPDQSINRAAATGAHRKEQAMTKAEDKAARVAALKDEKKKLSVDPAANAARLAAIASELKAEGVEDEDDDKDAPGTPNDPGKKSPDEGKEETEAQKIAKSPEAKAQPGLATAAIAQGLTYAQFQGMAEAPRGGKLASALAGGPRLGTDAPPRPAASGLDTKAIYDRRKTGARAAK